MRCQLRFRGSLLFLSFVMLGAIAVSACSTGDSAEAGAVGTSATAPLAVTNSSTAMTIENRGSVALIDLKVEIEPRGMRPPFRTTVPRLEAGGTFNAPFNQFRSADGTPFQRGSHRARTVTFTATDVTGKAVVQEIPFE